MHPEYPSVQFKEPRFDEIRQDGFCPVDMHVHTRHSDGAHAVDTLVTYAGKKGIGLAITDHNSIRALKGSQDFSKDVLLIPGIELDSLEGPHILLYFYNTDELSDFFSRITREVTAVREYLAPPLPVIKILDIAEDYSCVRVAAHPFGYFGINRGILKCIGNGSLPRDVMERIDAIEAICGGMSRRVNSAAVEYAEKTGIPVTGGSDAHVIPAVGSVVTSVKAGSVEEFLDGVVQRKAFVTGLTAGPVHKGVTGAVIAWNYLPSTYNTLKVLYRHHRPALTWHPWR